ncbi:MAG: hypothetical protein WBG92_00260, partial [Thiohalocapsa sp.]
MLRCLQSFLLLGVGTVALAQDYSWLDNPQLLILRAWVDPQTRVLYVEGEHFGERRLPSVTLDNDPLTVRSAIRTAIEAGPLPPGIGPGSHILRVVAGDDRSRFDAYSLEIGGAAPAPQPRRIPSIDANQLSVLDADGDVGWSPSIAIDG